MATLKIHDGIDTDPGEENLKIKTHSFYRPVSSVVPPMLSVQEICGSIPRSVKLAQFRQRYDVSWELCCPGAKPRRCALPFLTGFGVIPPVGYNDLAFDLI